MLNSYFLSESDVALIIKYKFHDEEEELNNPETKNKKRKITDVKRTNVVDYSYIKLPALCFGHYLDQECPAFIEDCLR